MTGPMTIKKIESCLNSWKIKLSSRTNSISVSISKALNIIGKISLNNFDYFKI